MEEKTKMINQLRSEKVANILAAKKSLGTYGIVVYRLLRFDNGNIYI